MTYSACHPVSCPKNFGFLYNAFSDRGQTKFDDDSNMHARLERWAAGSEARSKRLMLRRRKLFYVDEGFQPEKRRVMEAVESVLALWTRCVCVLARKAGY